MLPLVPKKVATTSDTVSHLCKKMFLLMDMTGFTYPIIDIQCIDFKILFKTLACGATDFKYKFACGSTDSDLNYPPKWAAMLNNRGGNSILGAGDWDIRFEKRPKNFREQLVDDCISAHIYKTVINYRYAEGDPEEPVMVIAVGDRKSQSCIQTAIHHVLCCYPKWEIHSWAWKNSCNDDLADFQRRFPGRFHLSFFDDFIGHIFVNRLPDEEKKLPYL